MQLTLSFTPKKRTEIFVKRKENKISLQDSKIRNITFFSFILFLSLTCLMKSFCIFDCNLNQNATMVTVRPDLANFFQFGKF